MLRSRGLNYNEDD